MLRFSANLGMLFGEHEFVDRFAAAARAHFSGVEFPFPYAHPKEQLAELLGQHGLTAVLFNLPPGDWERGQRGIACHPDRRAEFRDGVGLALEYATALGCTQINCLAGIQPDVPDDVARETLVDNLRFASRALAPAGIRLLTEPINTRDMPGFFLNRSAQAIALLDSVLPEPAWLQYDIYHMQVMEGDLTETIRRNLPRIAHFQLADNPGRHEPGTGEVNFAFVLREIERLGYAGWIGCEYKPVATTTSGLGWLGSYRS
jgi:hydroxypyruvate isomerase